MLANIKFDISTVLVCWIRLLCWKCKLDLTSVFTSAKGTSIQKVQWCIHYLRFLKDSESFKNRKVEVCWFNSVNQNILFCFSSRLFGNESWTCCWRTEEPRSSRRGCASPWPHCWSIVFPDSGAIQCRCQCQKTFFLRRWKKLACFLFRQVLLRKVTPQCRAL